MQPVLAYAPGLPGLPEGSIPRTAGSKNDKNADFRGLHAPRFFQSIDHVSAAAPAASALHAAAAITGTPHWRS
jgi:hypothetical protein